MPSHHEHLEGGGHDRHVCRGRHRAEFGGPAPAPHYPPDLELEPTHIAVGVTLDIPAHAAQLEVTHTLRANRAGATTVTLDAVDFRDLTVVDPGGRRITH